MDEIPVEGKNETTNVSKVFRSVPICELQQKEKYDLTLGETSWHITPEGALHDDYYNITYEDYCIGITTDKGVSRLTAIICDFTEVSEATEADFIYAIALLCSSSFLLAIVVVHLLLKDLLNNHGISIICQSLSLFIVLVGTSITRLQQQTCEYFAVAIIHYFLIANFSWLSVMSFDIMWIFRGNYTSRNKKLLSIYSITAWGVPAIFTTSAVILNLYDEVLDRKYCCIANKYVWPLNDGPIISLLVLNFLLFVRSSFCLFESSRRTTVLTLKDRTRAKERLSAIFKLFLLTGLMWTIEIVTGVTGLERPYSYITDTVSLLIPVFVFIAVVVKRRVLDLFGLTYPWIGDRLARHGWEPTIRLSRSSARRSRLMSRKFSSGSMTTKQSTSQPEGDPVAVQSENLSTVV